jgi:flagellar hook assembly protein FlgD
MPTRRARRWDDKLIIVGHSMGVNIAYDILNPGKVSVRIFDVSGRLIQTLVDRELPAGFHHAEWDGRAKSGASVSSGIYFYELRSGSFVQKRRMVLIR